MTDSNNTGGFSFCGVDIQELGLEYVPENQNTYVYRPSKYNVHEEAFDSHDGGYFYGTSLKPKDFVLRCIFQDTHINKGFLTRVFDFFRRGRTGKLVFSRRPWLWYDATVVSIDDSGLSNYKNGIIRITMRAYYPFGRTDKNGIYKATSLSDRETDPDFDDLIANTGMLVNTFWDLEKDYAESAPITEEKTITLYNPGTERAPVMIEMQGTVGDHGVYIINPRTKQKCKVVGLSLQSNEKLVIDSLSGKVLVTDGNNVKYGFLYHDENYLELEPDYPVTRDLQMTGNSGETTI